MNLKVLLIPMVWKSYNLNFLDLSSLFSDEFFANADHISTNGMGYLTKV